jgi:GTP-binding protein
MLNRVEIVVRGGKGGDGIVHFRHEKYIPFGGADGGDGGKGGDVRLVADGKVDSLDSYASRRRLEAASGGRGMAAKSHGKNAPDLTALVPPGTIVYELTPEGKRIKLADLLNPGDWCMAARGGAGGMGNPHFVTPVRQAPERRTPGKPGEERRLVLDFRLPVDVAILGYPNTGKSTLLSALTSARPKIADYPFTTTVPVLGHRDLGPYADERLLMAELPALVAGSHEGKGVGAANLAHAERARALVLLLDGSADAPAELAALKAELASHDPPLDGKPQVVAVNKMDLPEAKARLPALKKRLGKGALYLSALTGEGLPELAKRIEEQATGPSGGPPAGEEAEFVFRPKPLKKRVKK